MPPPPQEIDGLLIGRGLFKMKFSPERLAYWYLRLNGYMTTENFIIHPDTGTNQRTDADLLGVRFPNREELLNYPMTDDTNLIISSKKIDVIIVEVKTTRCALNGPWTSSERGNMERAIKAIGCIKEREIKDACSCLYSKCLWENKDISLRLIAIGEDKSHDITINPDQQITWKHIIEFFTTRFNDYSNQKKDLNQWPDDGKKLQELALSKDTHGIRKLFKLRQQQFPNNN